MSDYVDSLIKLLPIGTFLSGVLIERYKRKEIIIEKEISIQRVGTTLINHPFYGNIQIMYNNMPADNLYQAEIELQNVSNIGIKEFDIIISVPVGFVILQDDIFLNQGDVQLTLGWTEEYRQSFNQVLSVPENERPPTYDNDIDYLRRHRNYYVNVLNKKKQVFIKLLITGPENLHNIQVGIYEENVETIQRIDRDLEKRRYTNTINLMTTLFYFSGSLPIIIYSSSITIAVISSVISLFVAYYTSIALYYIFTFFRDYFKK